MEFRHDVEYDLRQLAEAGVLIQTCSPYTTYSELFRSGICELTIHIQIIKAEGQRI